MTEIGRARGAGPSFAVFKYLFYSARDSNKKAFMRIYSQIPIPGTEHLRADLHNKPLHLASI